MTPSQIMLLVVGICVFDAIVVSLIVRAMVSGNWTPLTDEHPARDPSPHAEQRNFQSFKLGLFNLGFSIHVAVDDDHLHLTPVKPLRWLGMRPMSLPWGSIELLPGTRFGGSRAIRLGVTKELICPAWCVSRLERSR